jgi:ABC-type amino acid transport system permease subunit
MYKLENFYYIFKGLYLTIFITIISLIIGVILGFIIASIIFFKIKFFNLFLKNSEVINKVNNNRVFKYIPSFYQIINLYKKFTINTPILTQLILFLYVIPLNLEVVTLGLIVLGLNSAAHISTIILDTLNNIPENYWYTSISLGLSSYESMKRIYFKYLFIHNKKALFNEFITLLKESSILSLFGVKDIIFRSKEISTATYKFLPYMLFVSFLYFIIITINEYIYDKFFTSNNKKILN